jgi:hypothetical protein
MVFSGDPQVLSDMLSHLLRCFLCGFLWDFLAQMMVGLFCIHAKIRDPKGGAKEGKKAA